MLSFSSKNGGHVRRHISKTLQRYGFLLGREKQTQEKTPLPTEKEEFIPTTLPRLPLKLLHNRLELLRKICKSLVIDRLRNPMERLGDATRDTANGVRIPTNRNGRADAILKVHAINKSTITSTEELWTLSFREVFGGTNLEKSGPVYSSLFSNTNSRLKACYGRTSATNWWLRSSVDGEGYYYITNVADVGNSVATSNHGVVFGFSTGAVQD